MNMSRTSAALLLAGFVTACSSNAFVASWKAPDAQPLLADTGAATELQKQGLIPSE